MNNSDIVHMINRNIYPDFDANTRAVTSQNGLNRSDQTGCAILREEIQLDVIDDRRGTAPIKINWGVSSMSLQQGLTQKLQGVGHV